MTIISPDGDSWSKHYSSDLPGFLNKDLAIRDMRAEVERTVHSIKGLEGVGGVRAINLKTGQEDFKNEDRS